MQTVAQKQNQPQKPAAFSLAPSNAAMLELHHHADPIPHLQRTIGDQALQRMLKTNAEEPKVGSTSTASPRFRHDFSRIPLNPPIAGKIQTKLAINRAGDEFEQEADRISEGVMRMPGPQQPGRAHESLQTKLVQASDTGQTVAPPIVHEVLASPGQPLDPATRGFMEPRFGHDFSQVRVHSDAAAEQSARDVNAYAYTVGHDVVFGAGQFAPATDEGQRLIAHELTHVVQQSGADGIRTSAATSSTLQRQPHWWSKHIKINKSGSKQLTKGTMTWSLELTTDGLPPPDPDDYRGAPSAVIQISFTPKPSLGARTITFLQTKLQTKAGSTLSKKPKMDILPSDFEPFYGADWDIKNKEWVPESAPKGYKNKPSSSTDTTAYLYDAPSVPPGQTKMFESVAVEAESSATLGALRWGVSGGQLLGAEDKDCTDAPLADFGAAVERFYATPTTVGPDPEREERYDAILDEFSGGDATLTADHEKQLDPIVTKVRGDPKLVVLVAGFGDAMDRDPSRTSEQRAQAVASYLIGKGVPEGNVKTTGFGAAWARYLPSMKEGRNRRVQIRLRY